MITLADAVERIENRKRTLAEAQPQVTSLEDAYALLASDLELGREDLVTVSHDIGTAYLDALRDEFPSGTLVPSDAIVFIIGQAVANGVMVGAMLERMRGAEGPVLPPGEG